MKPLDPENNANYEDTEEESDGNKNNPVEEEYPSVDHDESDTNLKYEASKGSEDEKQEENKEVPIIKHADPKDLHVGKEEVIKVEDELEKRN